MLQSKAVPLHAMVALGWRGVASTHSWPRHYMAVSGQRHAPAALCPGERTPGTHCTGGSVGPRAGLDTEVTGKIFCPCRGSNPGRPVRSICNVEGYIIFPSIFISFSTHHIKQKFHVLVKYKPAYFFLTHAKFNRYPACTLRDETSSVADRQTWLPHHAFISCTSWKRKHRSNRFVEL
jgi:hypothetical protein